MNTEWYVQDNWRVKQNFTIDAGLRFYYLTPTQSEGDEVAAVQSRTRGPALPAPLLYHAGDDGAQGRLARNPVTGEILPLVYLGPPGAGHRQLHQRDGGVRRHAADQESVQAGAAHRLRVGRHRRRQDRGPRRRRRVLRPVLRRQHPGPGRAAAAAQHLHHQLHDDPGTAGQSADRDADRGAVHRSNSIRRRSTTGAWACSATSAGTSSAMPPTSATPRATSAWTVPINGRPYGYIYQASSLDPTNVIGGITQPLPDDLLRPYRGYAQHHAADLRRLRGLPLAAVLGESPPHG